MPRLCQNPTGNSLQFLPRSGSLWDGFGVAGNGSLLLSVSSELTQRLALLFCRSPRRAGSLVFNADYESGNLGGVARVREFEYELTIRPDLNNSRHRIWFSFTVTNALAGQHALFTVTNFSKTRR